MNNDLIAHNCTAIPVVPSETKISSVKHREMLSIVISCNATHYIVHSNDKWKTNLTFGQNAFYSLYTFSNQILNDRWSCSLLRPYQYQLLLQLHNTHIFLESQEVARSTTIKGISQSARQDRASKWCLAPDPSLHGCGSPWRLTGPIHSGSLGRVAPLFFSQLFPIEIAFSSPTESKVDLLVARPLASHRTKCIWTLTCKSKTYSSPKTLPLMTRCSSI